MKNRWKQSFLSKKVRDNLLKNQLVIHGHLFSSNTIGGYHKKELPGGKKTTDTQKALAYDLNYIRTNLIGCETKTSTTKQCKYEGFLTVTPDVRVQNIWRKYFR